MHEWDQTDMGYYDAWARRICAGDWLSADIPLPFHAWHKEVAKQCFRQDPLFRRHSNRKPGQGEQTHARAIAVAAVDWRQADLAGTGLSLFVALTYSLHSRITVGCCRGRWCGVGGVLLVYVITERHFGAAAAVVAGLLYLLCRPLLMHEGILLRDATSR